MLTAVSDIATTWMEWMTDHVVPLASVFVCSVIVFARIDGTLLVYLLFFAFVWVGVWWNCFEGSKSQALRSAR